MGKKIWVIESGCYSDYSVDGVFSTKENAEKMLAAWKGDYDYCEMSISEWEMDPHLDEMKSGLIVYYVQMDYDGTTKKINAEEAPPTYCGVGFGVWSRTKAPAWKGRPITDMVTGYVWANDEKHAIKIANEFRTRAIANNEMHRRD